MYIENLYFIIILDKINSSLREPGSVPLPYDTGGGLILIGHSMVIHCETVKPC
jgi:hypothetical protein